MYFRFQVQDGEEVSFTEWTEEHDDSTASNAQRVAIVSRLRAAQPDAAIITERSQSNPESSA